ncbi:ParB/RepB/Spo0J family partition protein [Anaerotignum sp. MSJ-24]|uniref:ParB/RepB/Spo0J family partition protein n=1 Tax=Anaerotignum sp. MSJ-24 TaxID=2841521 RepID=UPI001C100BC0|nr:ParB/RepB/Spo0J family partition protein [Anaerotignum sp. MSJ-24]MBU5463934.1 ParB/RepB/Spo0J family partition protein [Anaerotignum sp. MSJ-24]
MALPKKGGLGSRGRGLEAVISQQVDSIQEKGVTEISIDKISPNREQPRRIFDETALEELAESMKQLGVIQPIVLAKDGDYYKIIVGERRWRAAKIAGLKKIPAIIKDLDETSAYEIALVENLQRENLNLIEEARGYRKLVDIFGLSQEEVAQKVGKSRPTVTNALRLLNLDERVQQFVLNNEITGGHARALLSIEDKDAQCQIAEKIIENGLSVRATEALVKNYNNQKPVNNDNRVNFDTTGYKSIEKNLKELFGTKVKLNCKKNKGKIEIEYYSDADLERILELITKIEE